MKTIRKKIIQLQEPQWNYNKHPQSQIDELKESLTQFGQFKNIVVWRNQVIAGNGLVEAARQLGWDTIKACDRSDLSETDAKKVLMADNMLAKGSKTDEEVLKKLLAEFDGDLKIPGLTGDFLAGLDLGGQDVEEPDKPPRPELVKTAALEDLAPSDDERRVLDGKRLLVEFSGGMDSSATVLWAMKFFPDNPLQLCFADLGADFVGFPTHLRRFAEHLGVELVILRSKIGMFEEFERMGKWPHFQHPYCHRVLHETLQTQFDVYDPADFVILRGGRMSEKAGAAKHNTSRFMNLERLPKLTFFQPLYFTAKNVPDDILAGQGVPKWDGYAHGLQRTACRICPGQRIVAYHAIRVNFPDVWDELLYLEKKFGPGCWQSSRKGQRSSFSAMADRGIPHFEEAGYRLRWESR